ncbi:hypothetical protein Sa4125_21580 [Aureimonas sp. SA4125]|nr:hypothetical protein Sa4125_21580 [Aureimonas sp. SA4125]
MAADSPAKLPPMMIASCRIGRVLEVAMAGAPAQTRMDVGAEDGECHAAQSPEKQGFGEGLVHRGVHRLFHQALPTPDLRGRALINTADAELEHDPERWVPAFGKDHARTRT